MVLVLVPIAAILTAFVAYAMVYLQHSSSAGLIGWLKNAVGNLPFLGGLSLQQILKLDRWMTNLIGKHYGQVEQYAVGWLVGLEHIVRRHMRAALSLAAPVWAFAYWIVHTEIPRAIGARTKPISRKADASLAASQRALRIAEGVAHAKPGTNVNVRVTKVQQVAMPHASEWTWLTDHWGGLKKAISLAAAGALAPTLPRVKPIAWPRGWTPTAIRRRIGRLEVLLGVTGFAAVMARVLRVSPRCLTTGNVGKTARRLCGMPTRWLDDVLGLLADFLIIENICTVLPWLEAAVSEVATPLVVALTDVGAGLCHSKDGPAKAMPVPALYLPTNTQSLTAGV